jgi:desulfoferrodoxin (superoxide reductase-like protein)
MSKYRSRRAFSRRSLAAGAIALSGLACSDGNTDGPVLVPEWQSIAAGLEATGGPCCWTEENPDTSEGAGMASNHAPLISVDSDGIATVSLAAEHPMDPESAGVEHWITTMYAKNQDDVVVGFQHFGQTEVLPQWSGRRNPSLEFAVPAGTTSLRAYSYCNLHDHWASKVQRF